MAFFAATSEEEDASLFGRSGIRVENTARARSFEPFDSASTNTAANTTSNSHSSQYTPVSSAEVGPQSKELRQEEEEEKDTVNRDEQEEDEKADSNAKRDEDGSSNNNNSAPRRTATNAGFTMSHDDELRSHTATHSLAVSQTSINGMDGTQPARTETSRSSLYGYGGLSITANISNRTAPSRRSTENSLARDNEESPSEQAVNVNGDEADAAAKADAEAHRTGAQDPLMDEQHVDSPDVRMPGANHNVVVVPSTFTVPVVVSSGNDKSRVAKSCTPPAAAITALDAVQEVPIDNPLDSATRVPLPEIKDTFAEEGVIAILSFLCEENRMDGDQLPSSVFHSHCLPPMTVRNYVKRVVTYSHCSVEALLCSLILLLKYSLYSQHPVTTFNVHRLFIASILLSAKMRDDQYYSNKYYASIGGIKPKEMNRLEVTFLTRLGWFISVREEEYAALVALLESLLEVPSGAVRMPTDPAVLADFAREHAELVASYDLLTDIDDVNRKEADNAEVRRVTEASPEAASAMRLERAFRRFHWRRAINDWLARLESNQLATDRHYEAVQAADWQQEEARWTRYREAERGARSSTSSDTSSRWMSPLTVNPPATAQWPTTFTVTAAAMAATATVTPTRQQQQQQQQQASLHRNHTTYSSGSTQARVVTAQGSSSGSGGGGATYHTRYANYPEYVQQSDAMPGSAVRYNANSAAAATMSAAMGTTGSSVTGGTANPRLVGSGTRSASSFHNAAFSAASVDQPHAPRVSPGTIVRAHSQNTAPGATVGNSSGVYGRGGLQSTAPPHQSHHSFSTWSQQRKAATATPTVPSSSTALPSEMETRHDSGSPNSTSASAARLNANAEPYRYVSSRDRRAQRAAQTTATTTTTSPSHADPQARFANWRSPEDNNTATAAAVQFPAAPQAHVLATSGPVVDEGLLSGKTTVAFTHFGEGNGSNNTSGINASGREEEWAASRRHSAGTAVVSASIAGKKRRKPQNYLDY